MHLPNTIIRVYMLVDIKVGHLEVLTNIANVILIWFTENYNNNYYNKPITDALLGESNFSLKIV